MGHAVMSDQTNRQLIDLRFGKKRAVKLLLFLSGGLFMLFGGGLHEAFNAEAYENFSLRVLGGIIWLAALLIELINLPISLSNSNILNKYSVLALLGLSTFIYLILAAYNSFALDYLFILLFFLSAMYLWEERIPYVLPIGTALFLIVYVVSGQTNDKIAPSYIITILLFLTFVFVTLTFLLKSYNRNKHHFYQSLMSKSDSMYLLIDDNGAIIHTDMSANFPPLWNPNEKIDPNLFDYLHKDELQDFQGLCEQLLDEELELAEGRFRLHDYKLKWHYADIQIFVIKEWEFFKRLALIIEFVDEKPDAVEELKRRSTELETFVYRTAHDFKGPLASIEGLEQIISSEITDKKAKDYFRMIFSSTQRLNEAVHRQLELTQVSKGSVVKQKVEFEDMVNNILDEIQYMSEMENVSIQIDIPRYIPLFTDENLMYAILRNLIVNAVRYKKKQAESHLVIIRFDTVKDVYLIEVEDTGIGVPGNIREKIFDMFYRGTNMAKGSGLGLYIVKSSVDKLNGKVQVSRSNDAGSTFSVMIPMFEE